ncbi:MAG: hypothetical protein A3F89_01890 [Deltaproteobacteria bacterium RIFCSPLOWO2_12_FULL_50_11]|nr:MAG: hypothetical protein A3B79_03470 [Deltaproteobacteria bacterium RIFCSPHIGHO2_02_FULL_50_15]OGQ67740.1 MAG: hypothetical protein A3F89_01890 [Deltaproteobacteria bacterium RIFCSPLOWO2_12_FULL_50_11]
MDIEIIVQLLAIAALLGFSASFSAVEAALFSLSKVDLDEIRRAESLIGKNILSVLANPRDLLTTILFGNEFVNVGIAIIAGALTYSLAENCDWKVAYLISVGASTIVVLIFGEIVPKTLALRNSLSVSYLFIGPLKLFAWMTWPFRILLTWFMDRLVLLMGGDPKRTRRMLMEEEFRHLVDLGRQTGTIEEIEHTFIENVFKFDSKQVTEIMILEEKMVSLHIEATIQDAFELLKTHRFSRIPVYSQSSDNIQGVLFAKDLIAYKISNKQDEKIKNIMKPAYFIDEERTLNQTFLFFQKERIHLAFVHDVQGKVIGMITMSDLLKELST